jgi:hypothetical protein
MIIYMHYTCFCHHKVGLKAAKPGIHATWSRYVSLGSGCSAQVVQAQLRAVLPNAAMANHGKL